MGGARGDRGTCSSTRSRRCTSSSPRTGRSTSPRSRRARSARSARPTRRPTSLLALDYRIRHLLVDEFQDTSITQCELLERLTAGWQPGDGRTLFVGRRPDAVDLPLPRGRGRRCSCARGASGARRRRASSRVRLVRQLPLAGGHRRLGERRVRARCCRRARTPPRARCRTRRRRRSIPRCAGSAVAVHPFLDGDRRGRGGARRRARRRRQAGRAGRDGRDPRAQPQPSRPRSCRAARGGPALPRDRDRAARRAAGGAGPPRAHARARASGRPRSRGSRCCARRGAGSTLADLATLAEGTEATHRLGADARRDARREPERRRPGAARARAGGARRLRRRAGCAAACATASRARGSRSAARRASTTPRPRGRRALPRPSSRRPRTPARLADRARLEARVAALWALPDVRHRRDRRADHDDPQGEGPRVRPP